MALLSLQELQDARVQTVRPPSFESSGTLPHHGWPRVVFRRYEGVGAEGYHSLFRWYQRFEAEHFPDPMHLRDSVAAWTLHMYPWCVQAAMALFDVPEAIAVARTALCSPAGTGSLTRLQACPCFCHGWKQSYQHAHPTKSPS